MNFRKAQSDDLIDLAVLFDGYRVFYEKDTDIKGAHAFLSERMSSKDSEIFVAENADGQLSGFVQLYPLFSSTRMKKLWLLNDLYVDPKSRGQGVSKGLINMGKELVKQTNACGMFLETGKSNMIGNKLYPKTGFKINSASNYYEWNNE